MAPLNQPATDRIEIVAPITMLYIRANHGAATVLDRAVAVLAERYAPRVTLQVLTAAQVPSRLARWAHRTPAVLVLRDDALVGEAIGAFLPLRELDRIVRRAVEWAHDEGVKHAPAR